MEISDLFSLEHKVALVTGASRGLGQGMAIALARAGAHVLCSSSAPDGTQDTIAEIHRLGGSAQGLSADLSNRDEVHRLFEQAFDVSGKIDILLNNGGTIARYPAIDYPMEEWDRVLEVNLSSAFLLSQLAARDMIARKQGKIINIASMLSYSGGLTVPAYTASKHAIVGITKAFANEWAQHNIQVNAIAPGYFKTDNTQRLQDDEVRYAEISKRIPAVRWGDPEDLAGVAIFLASRASDYLNGAVINVDGGWMAR